MAQNLIELSTPGEVLKEDFLDPMGITSYALAKAIYVDPPRIAAIIKRFKEDHSGYGAQVFPFLRKLG